MWIVRHGQSQANANQAIPSCEANELTEVGTWQARDAALKLLELIKNSSYLAKGVTVWTSRFIRTGQTSEPLLELLARKHPEVKVTLKVLEQAHEFTYLDTQLTSGTCPRERAKMRDAYFDSGDPKLVHGHGAESFETFLDRVLDMARDIQDWDPEVQGPLIVYSHGNIIRALTLLDRAKDREPEALSRFMKEFRTLGLEPHNCQILSLPELEPLPEIKSQAVLETWKNYIQPEPGWSASCNLGSWSEARDQELWKYLEGVSLKVLNLSVNRDRKAMRTFHHPSDPSLYHGPFELTVPGRILDECFVGTFLFGLKHGLQSHYFGDTLVGQKLFLHGQEVDLAREGKQ